MTRRTGPIKELWLFLRQHKSYWLVPIFVVTLLLLGLVLLSAMTGGAATPFIYTLF